MSRRILAGVLVAVLVASMLLAFAPALTQSGTAAPTTSPKASLAVQPAASITFNILNGYGYGGTNFYPGEPGWGTLCFFVTDPLDSAVNVTLSDPNAARDGVPSPAFNYVAKLKTTTSSFNSYHAGVG